MGYYLQIDTADPEPIASNMGWRDVRTWVESLPPEESAALRHFAQFGWENDVAGVASELAACLNAYEPKSPSTIVILKNWQVLLKGNEGATVVSITQGMG